MAGKKKIPNVNIVTPMSKINQALAGSLETGRVCHAYLFAVTGGSLASGEDIGLAWESGAMAFAARLNCEVPVNDTACGKCLSCKLIEEGNHPDVRVVSPDGLSIKINQVRGIQRDVSYTPRYDRGYRVIIMESAEKMTQEAQNSFLKVLEEPPTNVVFVLVTRNPEGLLPTVRSRCQLIRVNLGEGESKEDFSAIIEKLRHVHLCSPPEVLQEAEAIEKALEGKGRAGKSRAELEKMLVAAANWFRDVLVFKETQDTSLVSDREAEGADKKIEALSGDTELYGVHDLVSILGRIEDSRKKVRQNANIRLVLEALLFDLRRRVRQDG